MLFHVALRSLCEGDDRRLVLQEPIDKFTTEIELTDTSKAFTEQYLAAFRQPVPEKQETAMLQDRLDTGWLVWGKKMEVSRLSAWEEEGWTIDVGSMPAIKMLKDLKSQEGWWQKVSCLQNAERN
jgi:proteasome activator subunit 4